MSAVDFPIFFPIPMICEDPGLLYGAGTAVVGVTPLRARPSGAADGRREVEIAGAQADLDAPVNEAYKSALRSDQVDQ